MAVYGPYADDGPIAIVSHATLRRGLAAILCAEPARFADIATGGEKDLHDVVMSVEMESLAFDLAVQIRNRLVEAYSEVFRMQV